MVQKKAHSGSSAAAETRSERETKKEIEMPEIAKADAPLYAYLHKTRGVGYSDTNIIFVNQDIELAYKLLFDDALEKYNAMQNRPCRRIQNYYKHIASGNRESPFYEVIAQFGDSIISSATK